MGTLPGKGNHGIHLADAIKQTTAYREFGKSLAPDFPFRHGFSFNRDVFDLVLKDPNCEGLRFYFGVTQNPTDQSTMVGTEKNNANVLTVIFCAVDINGNDILATDAAGRLTSGGENSWPCPPHCSKANALNSLPQK